MPETLVPEVDGPMDRRLGYVLNVISILSALAGLAYLIVAVDELTGGALKRDLEGRWEKVKAERRRLAERKKVEAQMIYETWMITEKGIFQ